jgi:hypothetical protein
VKIRHVILILLIFLIGINVEAKGQDFCTLYNNEFYLEVMDASLGQEKRVNICTSDSKQKIRDGIYYIDNREQLCMIDNQVHGYLRVVGYEAFGEAYNNEYNYTMFDFCDEDVVLSYAGWDYKIYDVSNEYRDYSHCKIIDGIYYDYDTNTLTLNNVDFSSGQQVIVDFIVADHMGDFNLQILGTNNINIAKGYIYLGVNNYWDSGPGESVGHTATVFGGGTLNLSNVTFNLDDEITNINNVTINSINSLIDMEYNEGILNLNNVKINAECNQEEWCNEGMNLINYGDTININNSVINAKRYYFAPQNNINIKNSSIDMAGIEGDNFMLENSKVVFSDLIYVYASVKLKDNSELIFKYKRAFINGLEINSSKLTMYKDCSGDRLIGGNVVIDSGTLDIKYEENGEACQYAYPIFYEYEPRTNITIKGKSYIKEGGKLYKSCNPNDENECLYYIAEEEIENFYNITKNGTEEEKLAVIKKLPKRILITVPEEETSETVIDIIKNVPNTSIVTFIGMIFGIVILSYGTYLVLKSSKDKVK